METTENLGFRVACHLHQMSTEGWLKWWWHDTCLRAVSSHRLDVLHHSRREKGSICTNRTRITPKWDWVGGGGTRDGRWAGNTETDAVRCSLPTQKVVMWVFTASHVKVSHRECWTEDSSSTAAAISGHDPLTLPGLSQPPPCPSVYSQLGSYNKDATPWGHHGLLMILDSPLTNLKSFG